MVIILIIKVIVNNIMKYLNVLNMKLMHHIASNVNKIIIYKIKYVKKDLNFLIIVKNIL